MFVVIPEFSGNIFFLSLTFTLLIIGKRTHTTTDGGTIFSRIQSIMLSLSLSLSNPLH